MRPHSSAHTTAGSLVQPTVFSTNQKVTCPPSTKYNCLNTKYNSDECCVTDKLRGPVIQPFVGRRMFTALPKRMEIEPTSTPPPPPHLPLNGHHETISFAMYSFKFLQCRRRYNLAFRAFQWRGSSSIITVSSRLHIFDKR